MLLTFPYPTSNYVKGKKESYVVHCSSTLFISYV